MFNKEAERIRKWCENEKKHSEQSDKQQVRVFPDKVQNRY